MCKKLLMKKSNLQVIMVVVVLCLTAPVLAVDHWWHGGVSANMNDPANWTDRDTATDPTAPTGTNVRDIVRIGGAWGSEDLDGDGVLDPGEDLNGNGVIDDPVPPNVVGYGGYYSGLHDENPGGGYDVPVDPVLSETYVSRNGTPEAGWWFILNAPNILTLEDGAFMIMTEANCNLRNGGRLEVQGRSDTGGPSLITAGSFRIAENGSIAVAAHETSQVRIKGTGYMQVNPSLEGSTSEKSTWFRIGQWELDADQTPRGEVIIEESGLLEVLGRAADDDSEEPYLYLGHNDPNVNQIIIRDLGELWLPGDPETMGQWGLDNTVISLQEMIDMGLITNDQGGTLVLSGINPTMISVAQPWPTKPSPTDGESDVDRKVTLSWKPSLYEAVYDVYLGTDVNNVTDATRANPMDVLAAQGLEGTSLDIDGYLNSNQIYYLRIDAVNNDDPNSPWASPVWSFTTGDHVTIDDFEAYNDLNEDEEGSNRIYLTWSDGYANPNVNGSTIGYPEPDFANGESFVELINVYGGRQSGPFLYNNTVASSSEVTLPMSATALGSNWTQGDFNVLTLWFYGDPNNPATESLYVKLNNSKVAYSGDAADLSAGQWIQWDINLSDFAGVNLSSVTGLTVGTERAGATGSEGILFLDNIRLRYVAQ